MTVEANKTASESLSGSSTALWGGLVFSLLFTGLIWFTGNYFLDPPEFAPGRPGMWYLWQLDVPSIWTRATAWGFYAAHLISIWALIYSAQKQRPAYTKGLHRFNVLALAANAFFITLHLLQTHLWYDGLAQDVPEWSSQWSVIVLLFAVLLMENQRRGIAFGHKFSFMTEAGRMVRKYHGYYFSWAIIYTFWYHPMEATSGHLLGFLYMFLLLLQSSLFFTRAHVNRYWTIFQELSVVAHAVMVAFMNGDSWPMFLFGFAGIFVITQMHGLGLRRSTRWVIGSLYLLLLLISYSERGWSRIGEVFAVAATEYVAVLLLALSILLAQWIYRQYRNASQQGGSPVGHVD